MDCLIHLCITFCLLAHSSTIPLVVGLFALWVGIPLEILIYPSLEGYLLVEKHPSNNTCLPLSRNLHVSAEINRTNKKLENFGHLTKPAKPRWNLEMCLLNFSYYVKQCWCCVNMVLYGFLTFHKGPLLFCFFLSFPFFLPTHVYWATIIHHALC